jgi:CPA1 family monovalent cation:H+ antiporter
VLTTAVVTIVRFVWVFPATYLPRLLLSRAPQRSPAPPWQYPFLIGFTGVRGVVSLVAALSIPVFIDELPFPDRSLVLCVTFFVIIVSLFGQGTLLPSLIGWLGLAQIGAAENADAKHTELAARISGIDSVLARLEQEPAGHASALIIAELRVRHENRRRRYVAAFEGALTGEEIAAEAALELELVNTERSNLAALYANAAISDEARRRIERELDLEDALVRHAAQSAASGMPDALG